LKGWLEIELQMPPLAETRHRWRDKPPGTTLQQTKPTEMPKEEQGWTERTHSEANLIIEIQKFIIIYTRTFLRGFTGSLRFWIYDLLVLLVPVSGGEVEPTIVLLELFYFLLGGVFLLAELSDPLLEENSLWRVEWVKLFLLFWQVRRVDAWKEGWLACLGPFH